MANASLFGAEFRRIADREHLGAPAIVAVAVRTYATTPPDLWEAITTPDRLARWFTTVTGDLVLGGRYQLKGNAEGTITKCEPPHALDLTWEFGGATSWVTVRLEKVGAESTRLTLEHIAPRDAIGEEHFKKFGPGATGVGWDLSFYGLDMHLGAPETVLDHEAAERWLVSSEGKQFVRGSGEAWAHAHVLYGEPAASAREMAENTIAFYTGG